MDLKEYKRLAYSEEARKIMKEIKEKAKNSETQIDALKLIEQHKDEIPPYAFFIAKDLSKSKNPAIREKAEDILKKYYEQDPQYKEWERKIDTLNKKMSEIHSILPNQIGWPKINFAEKIQIPPENSKLTRIEAKIDEIHKELQELKGKKLNEGELKKFFKKKYEELEEDKDKAYL